MAFTNIISGTIGGTAGSVIGTNFNSKSIFQVRYDGTGNWLECSESVNITGKSNCSFELKLKDGATLTTMQDMFWNCSSLTSLDLSNLDTSSVSNMQSVFNNCSSLTSLDVSNFNTSQVTTMNSIFFNCSSLTSLDLSNFNTSKVTNMFSMFNGCTSLTTLNLSNFDTSSVTNMQGMFNGCSSLTTLNLSNFDTSSVTNMGSIFVNCSSLTSLDLANFDTSNVTTMGNMFSSCSSLTSLDLSNFDTSNVTNMRDMFYRCSSLTSLDLSNFDTSSVTNMNSMFYNCSSTDIGLLYATSSTINSLLTPLGTSTARNIYYLDAPLDELTVQDNITYKKYKLIMATFPYTLNKLPNGVADYIDVVNKVHVQRVGVRNYQETDATDNTVITDTTNTLYELATPIYTPLTEEEIAQLPLSAYKDGYVMLSSDQLTPSFEFRMRASNRYQVDMLETGYYYLNAPVGNVKLGTASVDVQQMPCIIKVDNVGSGNSGYRLGFGGEVTDTTKITLAKLPSHRIPTSFTQGMKCATDFGYWEGIKVAIPYNLYTTNNNWEMYDTIIFNSKIAELNRIEYSNYMIEDEFDIATGKLTKRIGKIIVNNNSTIRKAVDSGNYPEHWGFMIYGVPNRKQNGWTLSSCNNNITSNKFVNYKLSTSTSVSDGIYIYTKKTKCPSPDPELARQCYMNDGLTVIYYELAVPEISYIDLGKYQIKTATNGKSLQAASPDKYLIPQVKPSHLTYPVPSLVGNRTYTVVHNRKNITGSTKPIELNLGGTVVQLNDASGKTLVKTPSTLAHSNLIFIGGESTVDHVMVLDGDWTNKPIEYFENMKGHDTDAIITILGDGKIDDVAEQYLW